MMVGLGFVDFVERVKDVDVRVLAESVVELGALSESLKDVHQQSQWLGLLRSGRVDDRCRCRCRCRERRLIIVAAVGGGLQLLDLVLPRRIGSYQCFDFEFKHHRWGCLLLVLNFSVVARVVVVIAVAAGVGTEARLGVGADQRVEPGDVGQDLRQVPGAQATLTEPRVVARVQAHQRDTHGTIRIEI